MDMARKYLQLGRSRAQEQVENEIGKKFDKGIMSERNKGDFEEEEKEELKGIWWVFENHLRVVKKHPGYKEKMKAFIKEKKKLEIQEGRERGVRWRIQMPRSDGDREGWGRRGRPRRMRKCSPRLHLRG